LFRLTPIPSAFEHPYFPLWRTRYGP
jgi:hypothetical protein